MAEADADAAVILADAAEDEDENAGEEDAED
jgi:hypothetical protein